MKSLTSISALILAGSLAACGNNNDTPAPPPDDAGTQTERAPSDRASNEDWQASIAGLQALADEAFSLTDQLEADLAPINEALPELVSISWDDKSLDATNGATVFSGLRVTINTEPAFGMVAEEASVWGLNTDLISARLRGERLDETGLAFNRLDARNVSYFGVVEALGTLFETLEDEMQEEAGDYAEFGIDTFESNVSQMVMSNVSLRPYEIVPVADDFLVDMGAFEEERTDEEQAELEEATGLIRLVQQVIAVNRTFSIEDVAAYDTTFSMSMTQAGMNQDIDVSWDFYGYEDLAGFDLGRAVVVNAVQSQSMLMTDPTGEMSEAGFDEFALDRVETTGFMEYNDLRLDTLAGYLARAQFPGMDIRDLLSFGTFEARDYSLTLNNGDVFDADRISVDADSFAWLIPEDIGMEITGAQIGVQDVGELVLGFIPAEVVEEIAEEGAEGPANDVTDEEAQEFRANLETAVARLSDHDLGDIPVDMSARWRWGADSGETGIAFESRSEGYGDGSLTFDLTLPDYDAIQTAYESEDREAAFEEAFTEALAFNGARYFEADEGGYDKLFSYVSDIAKLYPQEGWGAMLGGMDAQQMRDFMSTMIRSGKQPASQQFPPAEAWLESVASYYATSGGTLEIKAEPPEPLTQADMEALGAATPEQIVEQLGLSVTQTDE